MSWQEVAELPIFKGKRKHRSLSQRRHTISRMRGPQYHEAERPWTTQEDKKLCSMGDAGKGLGDINRKFPTRNAERCLNRYFHLTNLKGYHPTSSGHGHTSHKALQDLAQSPLGIQQPTGSPGSSSAVARHREHRLQSSPSPYQSVYQTLPTSDRHIPSSSTLNTYPQQYTSPMPRAKPFPEVRESSLRLPSSIQVSGIPSSSTPYSTASTSWNNAASAEPRTPQLQNPSRPSTQQAQTTPFPPSSLSPPNAKGPKQSTPSTSTTNPFPPDAASNESNYWQSTSTRYRRPTTSSSASSGLAEDTPIFSSSDASPLPKVYDSASSQSVARKRRRPVMDEG